MGRTIAQVKKSKEEQQEAFLNAFADCANVSHACRQTKVPRRNVYFWVEQEPEFKARYNALAPLALGVLEDEATRRAVEGVEKPVFYKGIQCGTVQEYSDTLLIVLLKARAPEKYKERTQLSGDKDNPILTNHTITHVHSNVPLASSEDDINV